MWISAQFPGGEPIVQACRDAQALADRIACDVHFDFNGVHCMAMQGGDAQVLASDFDRLIRGGYRAAVACSRPLQQRTPSPDSAGQKP